MGTVTYDFNGETVVVTGGASGIGRAVARRFGAAGATVLVGDVRETPKDRGETRPTHELIADDGGAARFVETDVRDPDAVESLVAAARGDGGVDVFVSNAAINRPAAFLDLSPADLDAMYETNVRSVAVGTRAAARDMLDRDVTGCVLNTASISATRATRGMAGYDASKGAIRMLTRTAALELAREGIRVNAVAPGQIATEFVEGWTERAERLAAEGGLAKPVPLGRAGTPADLAGAYLYLASDDAAYVTGELVHVDGGWRVF